MYFLTVTAEYGVDTSDCGQQGRSSPALLPTLLRIGLPGILTDLIEGEVTAITEGTSTCGSGCSSLPPYLMLFFSFLFLFLLCQRVATMLTDRCFDTTKCRDAVLDIVLQIAEALSLPDEFATQLASNQKLFSLACQVIRLSHKDEVRQFPKLQLDTVVMLTVAMKIRSLSCCD